MSQTIATLNNGVLYDSSLQTQAVLPQHFLTPESAVKSAEALAQREHCGAAVLREGDHFVVARTPVIDEEVYAAKPTVVALLTAQGKGVTLRPTSDKSTQADSVVTLAQAAGLSERQAFDLVMRGVGVPQADALIAELLKGNSELSALARYAPRLALLRALSLAVSENKSLTSGDLIKMASRLRQHVVLTPDGYLQSLLTGKRIEKRHEPAFAVGEVYALSGTAYYRLDENGRRQGQPIAHLADRAPLADVEAAAVGALKGIDTFTAGIADMIRHPIKTIADIGQLPQRLAELIRSSPEFADYYCTLPRSEQIEIASKLTTQLALSVGTIAMGGVASAGVAGVTRGLMLTVPLRFTLSSQGALAFAAVPVANAAVAATRVTTASGSAAVIANQFQHTAGNSTGANSGRSASKSTGPSRNPNSSAQPDGAPAKGHTDAPSPRNRALELENESANILARAGYRIKQNPSRADLKGLEVAAGKTPDYLIEGRVFDCYAPGTSSLVSIVEGMAMKVNSGQTRRIVVNLTDAARTDALTLKGWIHAQAHPGGKLSRLKEVIAIDHRGTITRLFPLR